MTTNGTHTSNHHEASAQQLLDRLSEPRTAEALNRLLDHAELLAFSAGALDSLIRRSEAIADNVAESIAEVKETLPPKSGLSVAQLATMAQDLPSLAEAASQFARLSATPEFQTTLTTLSNPATLDALTRLLQRLEMLAFGIDALDALLQRGEELTDNVRAGLRDVTVGAANVDVAQLLETTARLLPYLPRLVAVAPKFIEVIERLAPFIASPEFDALLNSGVFHADTVQLVGQAGDAFVTTYEQNRRKPPSVGLLGLLRALRDPDVQRSAGLVMAFSKRFGSTLNR